LSENKKIKMSASQASLFNECGLLWSFKYLTKIKPDKLVTYDATIYGSALHSTLEEVLLLEASTEEKIEVASSIFLREFKKHFNKSKEDGFHVIIAGGDLKKAIQNHIYSAKLGVQKILNSDLIKGYDKLICEGEFNYSSEHFEIVAKIDLVGMYADETYDVVDFKTGKHFHFKGIKDELQALFYIMVCYDRFKILPNTFKFLKYDKANFSLKEIEIEEEITLDTIDYFKNATKKLDAEITTSIENKHFRKHDPTQKAQYCQWCAYKTACSKVK